MTSTDTPLTGALAVIAEYEATVRTNRTNTLWRTAAWELLDAMRDVEGLVSDADGRAVLGAVADRIGDLLGRYITVPAVVEPSA